MRKFLKQFQKGLRGACVTAALATCWNVGQTAQAALLPDRGDEVTLKFTGSVIASQTNINHLILVYGTGYSSIESSVRLQNLGDFPAGQLINFSFNVPANYYETFFWYVAGLYGDTASGQYVPGTNGVCLVSLYPSLLAWDTISYTSEQNAFTYILNDNPEAIAFRSDYCDDSPWNMQLDSGIAVSVSGPLINYSDPVNNGQIAFTTEIVPEPVTILLLGSGGVVVLGRKRRKE